MQHEDTSDYTRRLNEIDVQLSKSFDDYDKVGSAGLLNPYTELVYALRKRFDREELTMLAYKVGIDLEDLGGSGLLDICRRFVERVARDNNLPGLIEVAGRERPPQSDWENLLHN